MYRAFWTLRAIVYKPFFKKIGFPSYIGKPIFLLGTYKVSLGKRVRIYPMLRMEVHGKNSEIIIENNVSIGQSFHIISGNNDQLVIKKDTTISANVLVTNMDHEYQQIDKHILDQPLITKHTQIGENCFIGYGAVIQAGTILGKQCIVGANAVVRGHFPDYCVIVGIPAKIVKRYDPKLQIWRKTNNKGEFINE